MAKPVKSASVKFDKLHTILFAVVFGVLGVAYLSYTSAAPTSSAITGTLTLQTTAETITYGDTISFATTVEGRLHTNSTSYVTTVCYQNQNVVFVASPFTPNPELLLSDQSGDGLDWNGAAASCQARLMYRVQKGKGFEYTALATISFEVGAR